jgi:tetratricopeptide (TPR) repeat protein
MTPDVSRDSEYNPWIGLASYREVEHPLFFGRSEECDALLDLLEEGPVAVLHGPSGTGKTSLIQAGLFPRLRKHAYLPVLFRPGATGAGSDIGALAIQAVQAEAKASKIDIVPLAPDPQSPESLWEYFHRVEFWDSTHHLISPVLVLDQFEEIFTLGEGRSETALFIEQLADLVENRIPRQLLEKQDAEGLRIPYPHDTLGYRVLLSLRDDYVGRLDQLVAAMPVIRYNRYYLRAFSGAQAMEAVLGPGKDIVRAEIAETIVAYVAGAQSTREGVARAPIGEVQPTLLSVVCRELNAHRIKAGMEHITGALVERERQDILKSFYERAFLGLNSRARHFVEDRLVTSTGHRASVQYQEALGTGISEKALQILIDRRLLVVEERFKSRHVELCHDVLTGIVREKREARRRKARRRKTQLLVMALAVIVLSLIAGTFVYQNITQNAELRALRKSNEEKDLKIKEQQEALNDARYRLDRARQYKAQAMEEMDSADELDAWSRSKEDYESIIDTLPEGELRITALHELAWMLATCPLEEIRDPVFALRYAEEAIGYAPKWGQCIEALAAAHALNGAYDRAAEEIARLTDRLDPDGDSTVDDSDDPDGDSSVDNSDDPVSASDMLRTQRQLELYRSGLPFVDGSEEFKATAEQLEVILGLDSLEGDVADSWVTLKERTDRPKELRDALLQCYASGFARADFERTLQTNPKVDLSALHEDIRTRRLIESYKDSHLAFSESSLEAKSWWHALEGLHRKKIWTILDLCEELRTQDVSVEVFYQTYSETSIDYIPSLLEVIKARKNLAGFTDTYGTLTDVTNRPEFRSSEPGSAELQTLLEIAVQMRLALYDPDILAKTWQHLAVNLQRSPEDLFVDELAREIVLESVRAAGYFVRKQMREADELRIASAELLRQYLDHYPKDQQLPGGRAWWSMLSTTWSHLGSQYALSKRHTAARESHEIQRMVLERLVSLGAGNRDDYLALHFAWSAIGTTYRGEGLNAEALDAYQNAKEILLKLSAGISGTYDELYGGNLAFCWDQIGWTYMDEGEYRLAGESFSERSRILHMATIDSPDNVQYLIDLRDSWSDVALANRLEGATSLDLEASKNARDVANRIFLLDINNRSYAYDLIMAWGMVGEAYKSNGLLTDALGIHLIADMMAELQEQLYPEHVQFIELQVDNEISLGAIYYMLGHFDEARSVFDRVDPEHVNDSLDYLVLFKWLCDTRLGRMSEANNSLRNYVASKKHDDRESWTPWFAGLLLGDISEVGLLEKVGEGESRTERARRCKALYYIGVRRLLSGDQAGARNFFEQCIKTDMFEQFEHQFAKHELKKLELE